MTDREAVSLFLGESRYFAAVLATEIVREANGTFK